MGEAEFLPLSEAVTRLKDGMYGNFGPPEVVTGARKAYPGFSIGFGPQKEHASTLINDAIKNGGLSVFVLPVGNAGETPLQVPPDVLAKMPRTRGGLPDHAVQPMRFLAKDQIAAKLLAALSASALYVRSKEFEDWYEEARKKRNWPSHEKQRNSLDQHHNNKPPMGRRSKQSDLRDPIIVLVKGGRWSAQQKIADLVRLLETKGIEATRDTLRRTVDQLFKETGDQRYRRRVRKRSPVKRRGRG
jgi:hypothetical protein